MILLFSVLLILLPQGPSLPPKKSVATRKTGLHNSCQCDLPQNKIQCPSSTREGLAKVKLIFGNWIRSRVSITSKTEKIVLLNLFRRFVIVNFIKSNSFLRLRVYARVCFVLQNKCVYFILFKLEKKTLVCNLVFVRRKNS